MSFAKQGAIGRASRTLTLAVSSVAFAGMAMAADVDLARDKVGTPAEMQDMSKCMHLMRVQIMRMLL